MITVEHCEQLKAEMQRYIKAKGHPNTAHGHIRSAIVAIEFLLDLVRKQK